MLILFLMILLVIKLMFESSEATSAVNCRCDFLIVWFLFSLSMNHFRIQFQITVSQDLVVH